MRTISILALLLLLASPVVAGEGLDAEMEKSVREATRFIARQAVTVEGGVAFPEYAEAPDERKTSLYAGSAGVLVFLENAAALLEDESLRALADRTAAVLAKETGEGSAGLYTGSAGLAHAFLVRHRIRGDAASLSVARRFADAVCEGAERKGGEASWGVGYDVISGAAGTLLTLVEIAEATGETRYRDTALAAGRWLARRGTAEGEGRWWPARAGGTRHYPNFSHGTAGVAYALARVAAATGDKECRAAAVAGASWLLAHAKADGDTLCWFHSTPKREGEFREGWCHGPTGTGRLFLALHSLTGEAKYLEAARRSADWVMKVRPSPGGEKSRTRFYSPSLCCGAAGVVDFFVDMHRAVGGTRYRDYARGAGRYLLRLSKKDGDGRKWTNYDRPDEKGVIYHGVSLMLGASGEALALLRLAAIGREEDPVVHLPDRLVALGQARTPAPPPPPPPPAAGTTVTVSTPSRGHHGVHHVVLTNRIGAKDPYFRAALALARLRKGEIVTDFDPQAPEKIVPRLRELKARWVTLVLPPEDIDTNTQRRFLMAAARLDDDIFLDVAYGFVTGTARTTPGEMVARTKLLEKRGIAKRWVSASVASSIKSTVYPGAGNPTAKLAGWEGRSVYWGSREADPGVLDFVDQHLPGIEGGGVVSFSGCGDPEGTWLFDDHRNVEREKHWPFDPKKVGHDPKGEMPRITAERIRKMKLAGTVVFSGVCHQGSLSRVFVEGDIVSTFGTTEGLTEYRIPEGRSIGVAVLDAGAAAYVAPLGPNHGYRTLVEAQEAFEKRLALGDVLRSTYNDVAMAKGRAPVLDLYLADGGEVDRDRGEIMAGGGANRVLYGDPSVSPFGKEKVPPAVAVVRASIEGGFVLRAERKHKDWWSWDMFGGDGNQSRIRIVAPLGEKDPRTFVVSASATGATGESIAIGRLDAHVEWHDGERLLLHLQVAALRGKGLDDVGAKAEFRVVGRR